MLYSTSDTADLERIPEKSFAPTRLALAVRAAHAGATNENGLTRAYIPRVPTRDAQHFVHDGARWFSKALTAKLAIEEYQNAELAAMLMNGTELGDYTAFVNVPLLCRLDDGRIALVTQDLGNTMEVQLASVGMEETILHLMQALMARGIEWQGFAPRNLVRQPDCARIWLIDLEDTRFHPAPWPVIRRCTRLKWQLNWTQLWSPHGALVRAISRLPISPGLQPDDIDGFEAALVQIAGPDVPLAVLLNLSDAATLRAKAPLPDVTRHRSPLEIGHLLDGHLPARTSVLSTFLFAALRAAAPRNFEQLMRALDRELDQGRGGVTEETLRNMLFAILDQSLLAARADLDFVATRLFQSLKLMSKQTGLPSAFARGHLIDQILVGLEACLHFAFPFAQSRNIILRGSTGQGLPTAVSVVEFEYSGPAHPGGSLGLEGLLIELLALFGLPAEASDQRPTECDLVSASAGHRDANEWSQLRAPALGGRPDWLTQAFIAADMTWWQRISAYERACPTDKRRQATYLYKAARATLARAAAQCGSCSPDALGQIDAITSALPATLCARLLALTENALVLRQTSTVAPHMVDAVAADLSQLCGELALPDPFGGSNRSDTPHRVFGDEQ